MFRCRLFTASTTPRTPPTQLQERNAGTRLFFFSSSLIKTPHSRGALALKPSKRLRYGVAAHLQLRKITKRGPGVSAAPTSDRTPLPRKNRARGLPRVEGERQKELELGWRCLS